MDRCPNCKARWDGNATCRRCGMVLSTLLQVERAAENLTIRGITKLVAAETREAKTDFNRALGLLRTPFGELLSGFAQQLESEPGGRSSGSEQEGAPVRQSLEPVDRYRILD